MQVAYCNLGVVTITALYYIWRNYSFHLWQRRQRRLRERVTYMLWVAANEID
jgi:hypothetical protein